MAAEAEAAREARAKVDMMMVVIGEGGEGDGARLQDAHWAHDEDDPPEVDSLFTYLMVLYLYLYCHDKYERQI